MKLSEIRGRFIEFFKSKEHQEVASSPLVPQNDPTLMFVNAGMVPFKNYFTGVETPKFTRAVSSQKCVRAGGKHNDLENVGYTARHHTFFEMLGNFSFGGYGKEEAISYAWQFLTKILNIPQEKLLVTIYHNDDETFALWKKIANLTNDRIIRISTDDNFWSMGEVGPCGPCSEIFYDHGEKYDGCLPGEGDEGDRYIEIWNLVFMQFNRLENGELEKLPKPCVDTGMGLERISAIMQGVQNNFAIDIFQNIIKESQKISKNNKDINSHRVIADHLRSVCFLIADGVLPSNEGRGYVLRRICRRAMRHINQISVDKKLFSKLVPSLVAEMGEHYDELQKAQALIISTISQEENQFSKILDRGLKFLDEEIAKNKQDKISGKTAFKLYDTYGFPADLTADILRNHNLVFDEKEFEEEMLAQKKRGKDNWSGSGANKENPIWFSLEGKLEKVIFTGYEKIKDEGKVCSILDNNLIERESLIEGKCFIITDKTPFYAESGGQIADSGIMANDNCSISVFDTQKYANGLIVHHCEIVTGEVKKNDLLKLEVNKVKRKNTQANHSATHLLHKALQDRLGASVAQKGSFVSDRLLRFDFTHNKALSLEEKLEIEKIVNAMIRQNNKVVTSVMSLEKAKESGAMALFGEKYDSAVRVLSMGENIDNSTYSKELCGGMHAKYLGDIGGFKIISEGSVASGVRRIEAITGAAVISYLQSIEHKLENIADCLQVPLGEIVVSIKKLQKERKALLKENQDLKQKALQEISKEDLLEIEGEKILFKITKEVDPKILKNLAFNFRDKDFSLVILVGSFAGKASVIVASNNTEKFKANIIVPKIVEFLGGKGGGGKENFAMGGSGSDGKIEKLTDNLVKIIKF